jgi:acyl transferase domain-containing protein
MLSNLAKQHPVYQQELHSLIVATLPGDQEPESKHLISAIGTLWQAGVSLDWQQFATGVQRHRVPLPTYPFERQRYWIDAPRQGRQRHNLSAASGLTDQFSQIMEAGKTNQSPWLIFVDEQGPGAFLAQCLRLAGHVCVSVSAGTKFSQSSEQHYTVRPDQPDDYELLYKTLAATQMLPRTVLHCWDISGLSSGTNEAQALKGLTQIVSSAGNLQAQMQSWFAPDAATQVQEQAAPQLPNTMSARPRLSTEYVPPSDEYEQIIVDIWQQVLGIEQVGINDNFFELGGHSLIATQLVSRLRHTFQITLPLTLLFQASTPGALASAIKLTLLEEIDQMDDEEASAMLS